jgi:hypothetical protein
MDFFTASYPARLCGTQTALPLELNYDLKPTLQERLLPSIATFNTIKANHLT